MNRGDLVAPALGGIDVYPTLAPGEWDGGTVHVGRQSVGLVLAVRHETTTRRTFARVLFPQGIGWVNAAFLMGLK